MAEFARRPASARPAGARRERGFFGKTFLLVRKDLIIEARGRDTLPPMLAFCLTVALLLAFSLPGDTRLQDAVDTPVGTVALADVLAGFLWITVLFAGLIGFARTFEVEADEDALDALLLVPLDRSGLFAAKAIGNLVYVGVVQVMLVSVFALFFSLDLGSGWWVLALVIVLVDLGFVAVGTLFASLAAQTRSRELILPILALPALVPIFIAAVELTSDLFIGGGLDQVAARGWFGVLIVFDLVFVTVGALTFEFAID
ncbi:MAG: heme exporter protein CcmB [Actinomycetota bacterium]|nr:heme exporter protein CcmB [Actinomycetota bacterium]